MLTMLLGGLWHGAAWTFVVWGGIHGAGLAMERAWPAIANAIRFPAGLLARVPQGVRTAAARLVTFHVVCLAWVFFRAPDLGTAFAVLGRLSATGPGTGVVTPTVVFLIAAALATQWAPRSVGTRLRTAFVTLPGYAQGISLGLLLLGIAAAGGGRGVAPFIYFRF